VTRGCWASVTAAAIALRVAWAFVGFIVVSLVGAAATITSAFAAARKNRLDLSVRDTAGM